MKKKLILIGKHGRPSMRGVYSTMQQDATLVVKRTPPSGNIAPHFREYNNHNLNVFTRNRTQQYCAEDAVVIRWGSRCDISTNGASVVYNKSYAIKNATDKGLSRRLMLENCVCVPKLYKQGDTIANFPIIARPAIHAKGRNFVVLNSQAEFDVHSQRFEPHGWYYSEFIDKDLEFRFHCAHGKILAVMEKPKPNEHQMAWNRALNEDGDPFTYVGWDKMNYPAMREAGLQALRAVKAMGLDTGGVDVMVKGANAYVLEVNTSPTLNSSEYVSKRWGMYLDWLFRSDTRREHWDFESYKNGKSLIWKNFQLSE